MDASVNSGGVGLEETPKGLRQQFVQVRRTALGDERPRLVGEQCR